MVPTLLRGNLILGRSSGQYAPLERYRLRSHVERGNDEIREYADHIWHVDPMREAE